MENYPENTLTIFPVLFIIKMNINITNQVFVKQSVKGITSKIFTTHGDTSLATQTQVSKQ